MKVVCDICPICNKEFEQPWCKNRIYCSQKCNSRSYEIRNPEKTIFNRAKQRSKRDGLDFNISIEDINIPKVCPILGIELRFNKGGRSGFFNDSPSLDRIDYRKGYVKENIRVISNRANLLKSNATVEELEKVLADARCG